MNKQEFMEEVRSTGSVLGLERMERLCDVMGNLQNQIPLIHVAGTNGKGSVCAMLRAGLVACGLKVGNYSSPAVFSYEEIIQINGDPIKKERLDSIFEELYFKWTSNYEDEVPTLFELETAAAFCYFYQENCQIAIIETGLGGRMDATNVIKDPVLSVLTSISMDHCQILGNSLSEIAYQKAGIIKKAGTVVSNRQDEEIMKVLSDEVALQEANFLVANSNHLIIQSSTIDGICFDCKIGERWLKDQKLSLTGLAQEENLCLLIGIYEALSKTFHLNAEIFFGALTKVDHPGRFQKVWDHPTVIIDGAHNPDAAKKLRDTLLKLFPHRNIRFVIGVFKDKNYQEELKLLLPLAQKVYTIKPNQSRGLDAKELKTVALQYCLDVENCGCVANGIKRALSDADGEDCIVICGSLSILNEAQRTIQQAKKKE